MEVFGKKLFLASQIPIAMEEREKKREREEENVTIEFGLEQ